MTNSAAETVIMPPRGWRMLSIGELIANRDLLMYLVWRDIKVLYAQTILGFSWAILNPLVQIIVFTIVFGRLAKLDSEGYPYFLYSTVAIVPWTYMSNAMSAASDSLVSGQGMLGKVYFPRAIFPATPVLSKMVDFGISMLLVVVVAACYEVTPTWNLLLLPLFVVLMMIVPFGIGLWLSSLTIRFRDVKFAMPFLIRMLIYSAPILYSAAIIPEQYHAWYALNPIVAVIEGFRDCLLGTPIRWSFIVPGAITSILLLVTGMIYFKRMERIVVDVI